MFIDYQDHVMDLIFAQDRRIIELNIRTLAKMAVAFKIPVILSTVGVEMGVNGPTVESLRAMLPHVQDIDRSSINAWGDSKFVAAVKATGRKRLVMCGISTSACLTYPVVSALADGHEVTFIEDAVGDTSKQQHDTAVLRLAHAGAVPNTTVGMIAEWFLDWKLPVANEWRRVAVPYYDEIAALHRAPEYQTPHGFESSNAAIDLAAEADTEFMIGSAVPHPHDLALGSYSVHTSSASLRAGEQRLQPTLQVR